MTQKLAGKAGGRRRLHPARTTNAARRLMRRAIGCVAHSP